MTRKRFHLSRLLFWAAQAPLAMYIGFAKPEWERALFTYLVFISIAALCESAATDYDQARQAEKESR